jgi:release factor glutamine methyltransferase
MLITENESLLRLLRWTELELKHLGPGEAWRLFQDATGLERSALVRGPESTLERAAVERLRECVRLRKAGWPLAYVTGRAYFRNHILEVDGRCLIPRPETELLVEKFLEESGLRREAAFGFADLGAGSGAIGLALLGEFPNARASFLDISRDALAVARHNAERYALTDRAECIHSDLFAACPGRRWDAVLSNPPYLSAADWAGVAPELLMEPRAALDGGRDGFDFYRVIPQAARDHLCQGGLLFLEVGRGQAAQVAAWLKQAGYGGVKVFKDYAGIDRVVMGRRGKHSDG